jgi:integrase
VSAGQKSRLVFKDCKTAASRRTVSLTKIAVADLRTHRDRQTFQGDRSANIWQDTNLVFPSPFGLPLDPHTAWDRFQLALEAAGLDHIRVHDLCHSAATIMWKGGVNPKVVAEILGHANISMTLSTYSHVLPDMQRDAVDRVDFTFERTKAAAV